MAGRPQTGLWGLVKGRSCPGVHPWLTQSSLRSPCPLKPNSLPEGPGFNPGEEEALEDAPPPRGELPGPRLAAHTGERLRHELARPSPEPCTPSPAGDGGDLLLQALQQSCMEDHLLEAAWGVDLTPPEVPCERRLLCPAGFWAKGRDRQDSRTPGGGLPPVGMG